MLLSLVGGLCTTGLQDKLVSTMAAIISSISTAASDFLCGREEHESCWLGGKMNAQETSRGLNSKIPCKQRVPGAEKMQPKVLARLAGSTGLCR